LNNLAVAFRAKEVRNHSGRVPLPPFCHAFTPKALDNSAQGNTLGKEAIKRPYPVRVKCGLHLPANVVPFQGDQIFEATVTQGVTLG
jgi:hypothetical protein